MVVLFALASAVAREPASFEFEAVDARYAPLGELEMIAFGRRLPVQYAGDRYRCTNSRRRVWVEVVMDAEDGAPWLWLETMGPWRAGEVAEGVCSVRGAGGARLVYRVAFEEDLPK